MDSETRKKKIGRQLQKLRKEAGYRSAASFASVVGLKTGTYTSYEQGEAALSYETAWDIADALGCSLDELGGRAWPPGGARALTGDERDLIDSYRSTTPRGKNAIMVTAEAFRDGGLAKNNQVSGNAEIVSL